MREDEAMEDAGGSRVYEFGFHLDPELPQEEVKKTYQGIRSQIEAKGAVVAEGEPQKVPLAYTISRQEPSGRRDFDSAFFAWIAYETSAANHEELIASLAEEKRIVRSIDLLTTKEAARHMAEMQEIAVKMPEKSEEGGETVSDTELDAALEGAII